MEELTKLVAHLTERLTGQEDGKPKIFRDSAIENLTAFFERFQQLSIRSNEQLDELVEQCQQVVSGVEPQTLRDNTVLRTSVASELGQVQNALDSLLVDRPRRNILRRPKYSRPNNKERAGVQMLISLGGFAYGIYDEALNLAALGKLSISRASHVEPGPELPSPYPSPASGRGDYWNRSAVCLLNFKTRS